MELELLPSFAKAPWNPPRPSRWFRPLRLSHAALLNGMRWVAGPGTGKSRGIALTVVWPHLWHGWPAIILDPTGALGHYVLYKGLFLDEANQRRLWSRLKYVDLAATDYLVPMPLYYRRGDETLFAAANRLVQVIERSDVFLQTASIEGLNAAKQVGGYGGMLMAALGLQVTELDHLLTEPAAWQARLREVQKSHPELRRAVSFFRAFAKLKPDLQQRKAGSLSMKLFPLLADPTLQAAFAANRPGLDWAEEMRQRRTVLLDFGGETDRERRQFKLIWCFLEIVEFLKRRGIAGRQQPVLLVIDEISALLGPRTADRSILGQDLHELVTVWARNVGVKLCFAHQYPSQLEPAIHHALTQLGTQVIGNIQDPDDALELARQFHRYDPYLVKKEERVWMNVEQLGGLLAYHAPEVIDHRTVEFTADEQFLLVADRIRSLPKFHFLVRPASGEGNLTGPLRLVSMARLDAGLYPDEALVAEVRRRLRQRDGAPIALLLAEIEQRRQQALAVTPVKTKQEDAILGDATHDTHPSDNLPAAQRQPAAQPAKQAKPPAGDDAWQDSLWQDPA
jgi:hypothetical protein